jgi:hypothetical protein
MTWGRVWVWRLLAALPTAVPQWLGNPEGSHITRRRSSTADTRPTKASILVNPHTLKWLLTATRMATRMTIPTTILTTIHTTIPTPTTTRDRRHRRPIPLITTTAMALTSAKEASHRP